LGVEKELLMLICGKRKIIDPVRTASPASCPEPTNPNSARYPNVRVRNPRSGSSYSRYLTQHVRKKQGQIDPLLSRKGFWYLGFYISDIRQFEMRRSDRHSIQVTGNIIDLMRLQAFTGYIEPFHFHSAQNLVFPGKDFFPFHH